MVTEINPALCQGCGTCVAACPAGAITGTGFSDEQIIAQIDGLLLTESQTGNSLIRIAMSASRDEAIRVVAWEIASGKEQERHRKDRNGEFYD